MTFGDDYLTAGQVCVLLDVQERQVRSLVASGAITRVARGIYDRRSVEHYRANGGSQRTRTWSEAKAWGAIFMLSDAATYGLPDNEIYRLRATLRQMTDPAELALQMRARATVAVCSGHPAAVVRIRDELIVPGRRRLGLADDNTRIDGYIHADQAADLVYRYKLEENSSGLITLRYTTMPMEYVAMLATVRPVLAAADAATSLDPHERSLGLNELEKRLDLFRENTPAR